MSGRPQSSKPWALHAPLAAQIKRKTRGINFTRKRLPALMLLMPTMILKPVQAQVAQVHDAQSSRTLQAAMPPWAVIELASTHAEEVDAVHARMTSVIRQRQLSPLRAARLFAVVRIAQSEAIRQIASADATSVAVLSASQALSWMLPQEDASRWAVPALFNAGRFNGFDHQTEARIHSAVWPVLGHAIDDGADARRRPLVKPAPKPGIWQRTPPLFAEQPAEPQGAAWKPWCPGTDRIAVAPAVEHGTPQWDEELRQVAAVGASLTAAQKYAAQSWHLDAGSITPPGVWNAIAASYLFRTQQPAGRRHRVLALLNMAMQDALVAAWRIKFQYWTERPITAIRRELDPSFEPLLVTPPFPGYVSGHATVSAAAAVVLSHYFPDETIRWHALAREAALSRLYGGIHFASDNDQGLALGRQVAEVCLSSFEAAGPSVPSNLVNAPAGMSPDFFVVPRMRAPVE